MNIDNPFSGFGATVLTSPDGISWTVEVDISANFGLLSNLTFGNGTFVSAWGNQIFTSTEGRSWQSVTLESRILELAFGNGHFVATDQRGSILSSTDGLSWTERFSSHGLDSFMMAAYGDGIFLVLGNSTYGGSTLTSADGINWTLVNREGFLKNLHGIAHGNGSFVSVGVIGLISTSVDGISWSEQSSGTTANLNAALFGSGRFVAAGDEGAILVSFDGTTWTRTPSGTTENLNGIAFGNDRFVICGNSGLILSSQDGLNWASTTLTWASSASVPAPSLKGVTFGSGLFAAVGSSGAIFASPDGIEWTLRSTPMDLNLSSVHYDRGIFVATGTRTTSYEEFGGVTYEDTGLTMSSGDGITWSVNPLMFPALTDVVSFGDTFIAVGNTGIILQSDPILNRECIPFLSVSSPSGSLSAASDGNFFLAATEPFSVKIGLWPMLAAGNQADWWVLAATPFGWYCYVYPDQWYPALSMEEFRPAHQGPLFSLGSLPVLTISGLPSGRYIFYFGVDLLMNGVLDFSPLFYDHVMVDIGAVVF